MVVGDPPPFLITLLKGNSANQLWEPVPGD